MFDYSPFGGRFDLPSNAFDRSEDFIQGLIRFNEFGRVTVCDHEDGVPYFVNQFWTSAQRDAHSLHEIAYRGCFKPALPRFFIERLTSFGDVILDPFAGRGTTALQTAMSGRVGISNDVNPLSAMVVRARLGVIDLDEVAKALSSVKWTEGKIQREDLLSFYHPDTLANLGALQLWINERKGEDGDLLDPVAAWIRMVALTRLSGHSPGFFSGRSMPPDQSVTIRAQERLNIKHGPPPPRDVSRIILKKSASLLRDGCIVPDQELLCSSAPAWDLPHVADASVDLTVTSPPFANVINYAESNMLRLWFAEIDASKVSFAHHANLEAWTSMIRRVLVEQQRVLRCGGILALEVGEIRGGRVQLEKLVWRAADGLKFDRLGVMVNTHRFSKTARCWLNSQGGTNTNRVVLMQRM